MKARSADSETIRKYYAQGGEAERLFSTPAGIIERLRTESIIYRYAPKPPAVVYDIGGAAPVYMHFLWLNKGTMSTLLI